VLILHYHLLLIPLAWAICAEPHVFKFYYFIGSVSKKNAGSTGGLGLGWSVGWPGVRPFTPKTAKDS